MSFDFTKEDLTTISYHPHLLGHLVNKTLLTELHSEWILYIWDTVTHKALQGHRGSYKTTAIIIIGAIVWMLFHPNDRIAIIRKKFTDASDCVVTIRDMMQLEPLKALFTFAHNGLVPKAVIKQDRKLTYNFKKTITPEGNINAYGIDTGVTGRHFDKVLCDDFCTLKDRTSQAEREKVILVIQEIMTNVIDPGKPVGFIGTPWHKHDAWEMLFKAGIEPIKYDWRKTGFLSDAEIAEKKATISSSLFAANYDLLHVASEDALFKKAHYARWNYTIKTGVYGHIDAKYKGDHTNGLTFMARKPDNRIQAVGFTSTKHIKDWWIDVEKKWKKYFCGTLFNELNADKGWVSDKLKNSKIPSGEYYEKMNKHVKIDSYLYEQWENIDWDPDSDPEYINQILDYIEGQEPDDCPDSAASLVRAKFSKKKVSNLYER